MKSIFKSCRLQSVSGRRVLSSILAAVIVCSMSTQGGPPQSSFAAELEQPGQLEVTEPAGPVAVYEGEAELFQAVSGADLRTYATDVDWYLGIQKMESAEKLHTVKQSTDYGGNVVMNTYDNHPAEGMRYVLVNLALAKTVAGGENFQADQMTLTIGGNTYHRILEDSFLANHDYTVFPNTEILAGSRTGDVVFEVAQEDAAAIGDWKSGVEAGTIRLQAGGISGELVEVNEDQMIPVPMENQEVEKQFKTEMEIMETFRAGSYPLESPMFLQNIYGNAPLSGLVLFTTKEQATSIEVTVKGRYSTDDDITYAVDTEGTEHQAPVIGLYKDGASTIEIQIYRKDGGQLGAKTLTVSTPSNSIGQLHTSMSDVYRNESLPMEPGLTVLLTTDMAVIDSHGDVRWFRNAEYTTNPASGNKVTDRGTILCSNHMNGRSTTPTIFYEMNWLGKILNRYLIDDQKNLPDLHHETNESWDGTQLLYCFNESRPEDTGIRTVDKQTGAILDTTYVGDFLKKGRGDWAHQNTITPTADGHTYLLSFRHLNLVCKYDSQTKQIVWAFSKNKSSLLADNPKLKGKFIDLNMSVKDENGFAPEYFDHQHHITPLDYTDGRGDVDGNPNTEDILLYDNGNDKGHSRIVHYRIDTAAHTATQIFSYGKNDFGFYSDKWGSSSLLPQTGNYLGTASCNRPTEVTSGGEVVFRAKSSQGTYRAFRVKPEDMAKGFVKLAKLKGKAFNKIGFETQFVKTVLDSSIAQMGSQAISEIYLYENQLVLKGNAYISSGAKKNAFLVADDGKSQYYAPLLSGSTSNSFNTIPDSAIPISIDRIPAGTYNLGILVDQNGTKAYGKTKYYIKKTGMLSETESDNQGQQEVVEELIAKSWVPENNLMNPVVAVNPFGKAPLSAMAAFYTPGSCEVTVTVHGKPAEGDRVQADVTYTVSGTGQNHVVPIVGLYANYNNVVTLEAGGLSSTIRVKTGEVSQTYTREAVVTATVEQRSQTVPGLTFLTPAGAQTVPMAIDVNGELRWAYICPSAAPVETKPLSDGHFLVLSERPSTASFVTDAESALEIDLAGRIYAEYFLDGMPHHEVYERENGNLIFALSRRNSDSLEDYMVEVERNTGKTLRTWDFKKIMGIPQYDPSYDPEKNGMDMSADVPDAPHRAQPNIYISRGNHAYSDWFHQNSLSYEEGDPDDPTDDAIYVTGRHQSALIKINAMKAEGETPQSDAIDWIYTDPSWLPQSTRDLEALLLKPENSTPAAQTAEESGKESKAEGGSGEAAEEQPESAAVQEKADQMEEEAVAELAEVDEAIKPERTAGTEETEATVNAADSAEHAESNETPKTTEQVENAQTEAEAAVGQADLMKQMEGGEAAAETNSDYIYGPHAVEVLKNGDLIVYDNNLYGGKTEKAPVLDAQNPESFVWEQQKELYSRAVRLNVNEENKTFRIAWEYGREELKTSHYTPFIGDVDYLGGSDGEDDHYLIDFGGITKINGMACDVMAAMIVPGGTISADIREVTGSGDKKTVLWSAYLQGEAQKVSSVYRAERVNLEATMFSASDYSEYSAIENRGVYRNTPQADVSSAIMNGAAAGRIPIGWKLLLDEGNRLLGKFTLPLQVTEKVQQAYIVLELDGGKRRAYAVDYVAASSTMKTEAYFGFEIVKDNQAARILLLLQRKDGKWILGETGETASASMQYVTGEVPVIDPTPAVVKAWKTDEAPLLSRLAASAGTSQTGTLLFVEQGMLQPGMKYVYTSPNKSTVDFIWSSIHNGYMAILPQTSLEQTEAEAGIDEIVGTVAELRSGIIADDRNDTKNGALRSNITPEDFFYLSSQLKTGILPFYDLPRVLAMDLSGDRNITSNDLALLIERYLGEN